MFPQSHPWATTCMGTDIRKMVCKYKRNQSLQPQLIGPKGIPSIVRELGFRIPPHLEEPNVASDSIYDPQDAT